jgi:GT2 family glycosyltransferase
MKLSCIINARNSRDSLLVMLDRLAGAVGLPEHDWETIVIDNGSDDGTCEALARRRDVRTISLAENEGVPARNLALAQARGKYVAFLEHDIRPLGMAIPQALAYLSRNTATAAVVGLVVLPDGTADAPALPSVLMSGASIVRKSALDKMGGFAAEFFREAADYESSFRLWRAGYRIQRFEDLQFARTRMPAAKSNPLICRMDLRNNLILCARYLPRPLRHAYRQDWMRRYALLARHEGRTASANTAIKESRIWARREAAVGRRLLGPAAVESIFGLQFQRDTVLAWAGRHQIRNVCIADWGKNLYATWSACRSAGLKVRAVLDDLPAFAGSEYRGIPVVSESSLDRQSIEGILLSTVNPAHVHARAAALESRYGLPVLRLWEPAQMIVPPPRRVGEAPVAAARKIDRAA